MDIKDLNGGIDPLKDPVIQEDWKKFSQKEREAATIVAKELQKVVLAGGDPDRVLKGVLARIERGEQLQSALDSEIGKKDWPNMNASEDILMAGMPVDVSKNERVRVFQDGRGLQNHIKGLVDTMTPRSPPGTSRTLPHYNPNTMIFKKTIEDFDRMFETKIMRVGDGYKSFEYEKATSIPYKEARICFLPNPLPANWNSEFAKDVSEEVLLGLPFQTTWVEAIGSWDKGPASAIDIDDSSDPNKKITIQFCGAFLETKMSNGSPCLQVKAVMAAGAFKNGDYQNTVFISNYILTTHLIKWVQDKIGTVDFSKFQEEDYKAYPIIGPSVFPIVGFLISLRSKQVRMGAERVNERMKIGSGKGKEVFKIKEVVHVHLNRKESQLPKIGAFGSVIDWSHRWEVMGHWRKIAEGGIGKNAAGEYCVRAFTWVTSHERGPEDKPLVKKTRVIMNDGFGDPSKFPKDIE